MKKILNVIFGLSLLMAGCSDGQEYVNALPKNAAVVASVDLDAIVGKSGINKANNASQKKELKQLVKGAVNGAAEWVDALFEDAGESGIDFGKDVYCFAGSGMANYGFVAKIKDSDRLEDLLKALGEQGICSSVEDTDGGRYVVAANWLLAFSDKAVVVMTDAKDTDARKLVRRASMMLRQEEGEGFSATSDFTAMCEVKSDINLWLTLEMLPREIFNPMTMGATADMDLKDVKGIAHINFESGKTVVNFKMESKDSYISSLIGKAEQSTGDIAGRLAVDFPANTPVWLNSSLNGKELYDMIQSIPMGRRYFEKSMLPLDFKQIFGSMKGDCALAITNVQRKYFILVSEVKDKAFMKSFEGLKPLMKLTNGQAVLNTVGEDEYEFITTNASLVGLGVGPAAYWFGVKGDKFYLTNDRSLVNRRVLGLSMADRPFSKEINGNQFYMSVNMEAMKTERMEAAFMQLLDQRMQLLFGGLNYMTISVGQKEGNKIEFVMKDKNKNMIEQLLMSVGS